MKCFAIILIVLAFWPMFLDCSLSGRQAFAPSPASPTKTYSSGDVFNMRTAVLQVLPTPHMVHHNKGGPIRCFQVNPVRGAAPIEHTSLDLAHRHVNAAWSRVRHRWRIGSAWLIEAVIAFVVYLLFSITVGVALLSKATVERRATIARTQRKHTSVSSTTLTEGLPEGSVHEPVIQKPRPINTFTLEGRLALFSGPSTSESPVEWTVLFHPCQYYFPDGSATKSRDRNSELDAANKYLLNMLFHGVTAYHPWTWYTPGMLVNVSKEVVKEGYTTRKPKSVLTIPSSIGTPKSNDHRHIVQRRMAPYEDQPLPRAFLALAVRESPPSHNASPPGDHATQRHGSRSLRLKVEYSCTPGQPRHPESWIEKFTLEGRVLLYAGSSPPGKPVKWVIRFDLYYGRHITRHGDESSTCEREFMDGHLPHILLCGGVAYSSSVVYVPSTLFDVPEETVKESNNLAITSNSLDVTTTISGLFLPSHHTPDVATIIGPRVPPIDVRAASFELDGCANHEDLVAPDPLEERSSVEIVHEVVPGNARENAKDLTSSDHTSPTSQHIASLDLTYDPLLREQRAAGVHEPFWKKAWTEVGEPNKVDGARMEEDQQEEVHQRRKRRGGKRNTAWKNKRRQEKDDHEPNPETGPSGLR